ncbi:MAG: inorganic diphosphatase [Candidatus Woesearchaeota archaeon]
MINARSFLEKIVTVTVDRPIGSRHPEYGNIYPINYGYIRGVKAPDGEDLDAYILGISEPVKKFTGRCIAVIHRSDNDDKLVVAPNKTNYTDRQILALTNFQEKYFKSEILRK